MWSEPKASKIIVTLRLKNTAELVNSLDKTSELYNGYMNILTAMFYMVYIEMMGSSDRSKLKKRIHHIQCSNGACLQDQILENEVQYESIELMYEDVGLNNLSELDVANDKTVKTILKFLDKFASAASQALAQDLEMPDERTHITLKRLALMDNTMYIDMIDSRTIAIIYTN